MPPDQTGLPNANRRTVLKALGTGALLGSAARPVAAQEQNFEISVPVNLEIEPGERVTFDMSLTQLASTPDPDSDEVTDLHARVGFQSCPSEVVGADEIDCSPPSWTEYEIVDHSEEQGEWSGSDTGGEWWWTSPDDVTNGETRSFSVTIEVSDDATPGAYEVFVICWSYPAGPRILPQPQLDERVSATVSVSDASGSGAVTDVDRGTDFPRCVYGPEGATIWMPVNIHAYVPGESRAVTLVEEQFDSLSWVDSASPTDRFIEQVAESSPMSYSEVEEVVRADETSATAWDRSSGELVEPDFSRRGVRRGWPAHVHGWAVDEDRVGIAAHLDVLDSGFPWHSGAYFGGAAEHVVDTFVSEEWVQNSDYSIEYGVSESLLERWGDTGDTMLRYE